MIPTVEEIVEMLLAHQCTKEQAMLWLAEHFVFAEEEVIASIKERK